MNKVQTAVTAIQGMTANEIDQVLDAINFAQDLLARQHSRLFAIGDVVKFKPPQRHGRTLIGTVEKVNRKTVIVNEHGGGKWNLDMILRTTTTLVPTTRRLGWASSLR